MVENLLGWILRNGFVDLDLCLWVCGFGFVDLCLCLCLDLFVEEEEEEEGNKMTEIPLLNLFNCHVSKLTTQNLHRSSSWMYCV